MLFIKDRALRIFISISTMLIASVICLVFIKGGAIIILKLVQLFGNALYFFLYMPITYLAIFLLILSRKKKPQKFESKFLFTAIPIIISLPILAWGAYWGGKINAKSDTWQSWILDIVSALNLAFCIYLLKSYKGHRLFFAGLLLLGLTFFFGCTVVASLAMYGGYF